MAILARAVVSRLLHEPTLKLKGASADGESYVYVQALRELFGLEPDGPAAASEAAAADDSGAHSADVASLEDRRRRRSSG